MGSGLCKPGFPGSGMWVETRNDGRRDEHSREARKEGESLDLGRCRMIDTYGIIEALLSYYALALHQQLHC